MFANLWSSRLVWLRDRVRTVEPERTALIRRVRFPAAGAASYRASWKMHRLSLPGRAGLVKWYLHIPAPFAAGEGFRSRKCPVAKKRSNISGLSVFWQFHNNTSPGNHMVTVPRRKLKVSVEMKINVKGGFLKGAEHVPGPSDASLENSYRRSFPVSGPSLASSRHVHLRAALELPPTSLSGHCD